MAIPTYIGAGTAGAGTGSVSAPWPALHKVGDVALLLVESCGGEPATLSTPAGFVEVTGSPQATGAGTDGTRLTLFWCRATTTTQVTPVVAVTGDHVQARLVTFRGCAPVGDPWDATAGSVKATASTSVVTPSVTTTVPECLIVHIVTRDTDSATSDFSAWSNVRLGSVTERLDTGTIVGNGGGYAVTTGTRALVGAILATTATVVSSINALMTIALKPSVAVAGAADGAGTTTATAVPAVAGTGTGAGTATATATPTHTVTGTGTGSGAATAVATPTSSVSGAATGSGAASGSTVPTFIVTGTATSAGSASATVTTAVAVSGAATGAGTVTGAVSSGFPVDGTATGQGDATGAVVPAMAVTGQATGQGDTVASAATGTQRNITGHASAPSPRHSAAAPPARHRAAAPPARHTASAGSARHASTAPAPRHTAGRPTP